MKSHKREEIQLATITLTPKTHKQGLFQLSAIKPATILYSKQYATTTYILLQSWCPKYILLVRAAAALTQSAVPQAFTEERQRRFISD